MAEQALKMDEECADALHVVAEYSPTLPELVRGMERASRVARQQIESTLGQGPPDVWTMVDAGPYLRAERRIADALRSLGELEEANRHYETVLAVDTEDFGTARPLLLGSYLALNLLEESRGLLLQMEQQAEEDWALITWGRILERFLSGDVATAERLAKPAMRKNRYIQKTLTASRMPKNLMPGDAKPGSQGEALLCMYTVGIAWLSHEPAMDWLRGLQ